MAFRLAELFVDITGRKNKLDGVLSAARGQLTSWGVGLGVLGGNLATQALNAATGSIAGFFGEAIEKGADLEEAIGRAGQTFGTQGRRILALADDLNRKYGQANATILQGAENIGGAFRNAHFQAADVAGLTEQATRLASDYSRQTGTPLATAFEEVKQAIEGQNRALRGANLVMDEQEEKVYAIRAAMNMPGGLLGFYGGGTTDAAEKLGRFNLLLDKFRQRAGGMGGGGNRFNGLYGQLVGRLDDAKAKLGLAAMPLFETAMRAVNHLLAQAQPWIDRIAATVKEVAEGIAEWTKYLALLGTNGGDVWELFKLKGIDVFNQVMAVAKNLFSDLASFLGDLMDQVFSRMGAQLTNTIAGAAHEAKLAFMASSSIAQQFATKEQIMEELRLRYPAPQAVPVPGVQPKWNLMGDPLRNMPGANPMIDQLRTQLDAMVEKAVPGITGKKNEAGAGDNGQQMFAPIPAQHTDLASFAKQLQEKISGNSPVQLQKDQVAEQKTTNQKLDAIVNQFVKLPVGNPVAVAG